MNYEIVMLKEKVVVGISAMTSNADPKMPEVIGGLWHKFYQTAVISRINNKVNQYAIGLYSDYSADKYCVTVGNEVSKAENDELTVKTIPAGKYARFSLHGPMDRVVAEAWTKIWEMDLDRSFTGDFEEYLNSDIDNADIDIYIALK